MENNFLNIRLILAILAIITLLVAPFILNRNAASKTYIDLAGCFSVSSNDTDRKILIYGDKIRISKEILNFSYGTDKAGDYILPDRRIDYSINNGLSVGNGYSYKIHIENHGNSLSLISRDGFIDLHKVSDEVCMELR